ncbi:hypothetical protein L208DRAFT_1385588 [Tricholoma matsutake]|nr:hypothetical protein L208DRAFT_1385588 [Tricholoma matsutake 945]
MSLSKPFTISRASDLILGSFAFIQPSETLDHLVRYLGTWSGSDKLFMLIHYAMKLLVPLLTLRARLQYRAGLRDAPTSRSAEGYAKLATIVGDSRTLWRIWGLLPIVQWLVSLERNPTPTRRLLTIERLQGWSMLAYYPLEHLSYLSSHGIIPSTVPTISSLFSSTAKYMKLDPNILGIWSCRFWAIYVVLQFAHLREDRKLLLQQQRTLRKGKGTSLSLAERQELQQRWDSYWSELIANIGYLPLTIHWSLKKGLFKNEVWVGIFGLIAAAASFRSGWKATALTPPLSLVKADSPDSSKDGDDVVDYDVSSI